MVILKLLGMFSLVLLPLFLFILDYKVTKDKKYLTIIPVFYVVIILGIIGVKLFELHIIPVFISIFIIYLIISRKIKV